MPTGTRISTPIPRSYLTDPRFNALKDTLARESYLRLKLMVDNVGRIYGDPATLAGLLYPVGTPTPDVMEKIIKAWARCGLVFRYRVGRTMYIEVSDTGYTQKFVGNMTTKSDFPPPPQKLVASWERKTGLKWYKVEKKEDKDSKVSTDDVQTGTDKSERVSAGYRGLGNGSSKDRLSREGLGSGEGETDLGADAPLSDQDRIRVYDLLNRMTEKNFDMAIGFNNYPSRDEFFRKLLAVCRNRSLTTKEERIEAMRRVTNACEDAGFKAPRGWIKVLTGMRDGTVT